MLLWCWMHLIIPQLWEYSLYDLGLIFRQNMSLGQLNEFGQYVSELELEKVPDLDKNRGELVQSETSGGEWVHKRTPPPPPISLIQFYGCCVVSSW